MATTVRAYNKLPCLTGNRAQLNTGLNFAERHGP